MRTFTNMAWPDDPYGTGQLWRAEPSLLAAFAASCIHDREHTVPVGYAAVYLRLHRTGPVDVTGGNLAFGFRAMTARNDSAELVRMFDLDVMRARRLAKVVAGHQLDHALAIMGAHTDGDVGRGIRSLHDAWTAAPRRPAAGMAAMIDTAYDLDGKDLPDAAGAAGIDTGSVRWAFQPQRNLELLFDAGRDAASASSPSAAASGMAAEAADWIAVRSIERALVSALVAARHLDRYVWDDALDIAAAVAANAADCFPSQSFGALQT